MRKLGTVLMIFLFFVMKLFGQATISDIKLTPDLDITWFEAYTLSAKVVPDAGVSIQTVTFSVRPQSVSDAILNWDYLTDGTAIPMPNVPLEYVGTITDTNVYTFDRLRPDDIYPEIRYIPEITSPPDDSRFHRSNYHLMKFTNPFPMGVNTSFFIELYASPAAHPSVPNLEVYLVGKGFDISEFQTGAFTNQAWMNHPDVESVGNISQETPYHHTHTANSMHFLIPLSTNADGKLGNKGIDISENFWIILYNNAPQSTRGWDLKYHAGNNNSTWYKGGGTNFTVQSGLPDVHVHFARRESTTIADWMDVKVEVDYTGGDIAGPISLSNTFSFGDLPNLAPNVSSFTAPAPGTYSDNVTISWNPALDPNITNTLTYYLELVDYSTKAPIYTDLPGQTQTSTIFNTLLVPNGDYDILVKACDDGTPSLCTPFYWSSTQVENAKFTINNYDSSIATWTGDALTTDWATAGNWNPPPVGGGSVEIPTGKSYYPVLASNVAISNLTVESGASLTIAESGSLTVTDIINNQAGNGGIVLKSSASGTGSLIHSTAIVAGTIERYIAGWTSDNHGWHFLSTPVAGQAIGTFHDHTLANDFYMWDESVSDLPWINRKVTGTPPTLNGNFDQNFLPGRGYLVANSATGTESFTGTINSSDIPINGLKKTAGSHAYHGWHLLGNPFASALWWNNTGGNWALINVNANCQIWNEANASYTIISPDGVIPAMNGFMVYTTGTGSLTIPASARVHSTEQWYKQSKPAMEHIKLIARDPAGQTAQESLIRFDTEAPGGFCMTRDSYFLEGFAPLFYSFRDDKRLSMNTLPEMRPDLVIPMGFRKNASDAFSIELAEFMDGISLYLYDKKTSKEHLLLPEHPYAFTSEDGDDDMRFEIRFKSVNETTGIDAPEQFENTRIFATNNVLHVQFDETQSSRLEIYDLSGRLLLQQVMGETMQYDQPLSLQTGVYLVRVTGKNFTRTEKIIIE